MSKLAIALRSRFSRLRSIVFLFALHVLVATACAAPAEPPKQDFLEYGFLPTVVLILVSTLLTLVVLPFLILFWALFIYILIKIIGRFGVTPQMMLMGLVQRQMMGKGKWLIWQLAVLICLPAGVGGLWLGIWMFGVPARGTSMILFGSLCGIVVAVGLVWLVKFLLRGLKGRLAGGMQGQMMAEMMRMRGGKIK